MTFAFYAKFFYCFDKKSFHLLPKLDKNYTTC